MLVFVYARCRMCGLIYYIIQCTPLSCNALGPKIRLSKTEVADNRIAGKWSALYTNQCIFQDF